MRADVRRRKRRAAVVGQPQVETRLLCNVTVEGWGRGSGDSGHDHREGFVLGIEEDDLSRAVDGAVAAPAARGLDGVWQVAADAVVAFDWGHAAKGFVRPDVGVVDEGDLEAAREIGE